jgi:hypothetical protein
VDFLRLAPWTGSGMVGTNATGLFTLRPDFVRVGSGVYESETSESSSSFYTSQRTLPWYIRHTYVTLLLAVVALPLPSSAAAPTSSPSTPSPRAAA